MKWLKLFLLSSPLFICALGLFGLSENTSAVQYNSWLNIQDISKTNLSNDWITHNTNNAGSYSVSGSSSLQTYRLSASAYLPSQVSGAYFSAKGDIYIDIPSSLEGGVICELINDAMIVPEYVSYNTTNSVLTSCSVSSPNIYMRRYTLHIETSGSIPSQGNFTSFFWSIGNTSNQTIISLVGTPDESPRVFLSANINISISTSPELEGLGVINQNITIISNDLKEIQQQNEAIINQMEATNDWLIDDTPPSADTSSLGNAAGWLPPGPLDSILNLPIQFIQGIIGVFTNSNTCSPIVLPIGIVDYDLRIPCMRPFFDLASVNIVWNTVGTIISAILIFHTLKWLYKFVDDTLSFRENNSSMWGGL